MAAPAAEGFLSLALSYLAATIAASARFQSVCNESDATGALTHIHEYIAIDEEDPDDETLLAPEQAPPRCIIRNADEFMVPRVGTTGFEVDLNLIGVFEFPVVVQNKKREAWALRQFHNDLGTILEQMSQLAGTAGYLNLIDFGIGPSGLYDQVEEGGKDIAGARVSFTAKGEIVP